MEREALELLWSVFGTQNFRTYFLQPHTIADLKRILEIESDSYIGVRSRIGKELSSFDGTTIQSNDGRLITFRVVEYANEPSHGSPALFQFQC